MITARTAAHEWTVTAMDDTISRAAALKGLEDLNIASFYEENEHSKEAYTEVKAMLKALPSAQTDHIGEVTEMVGDTISRSAAIEAMRKAKDKSELHRMLVQLTSAQQIPWDKNTRNSMKYTLQSLYRLAYHIHGVMDSIDDDNVNRLIEWLEGGQDDG